MSQNPELKEKLEKLNTPAKYFLRSIAFTESKTAARLINADDRELEKSFNKISLLKNGIQERMIPNLSANCKKEIQGSFKIVDDQRLRELADMPSLP